MTDKQIDDNVETVAVVKVWEYAKSISPLKSIQEIKDSLRGVLPWSFLKAIKEEDRPDTECGLPVGAIQGVNDIPVMTPGLYSILTDSTDHRRDLCNQLCKSRGSDIYPKSEVEKAYGIMYLLNHYRKDPINWNNNAHVELEAFEKAKIEMRRGDSFIQSFFDWIAYPANKEFYKSVVKQDPKPFPPLKGIQQDTVGGVYHVKGT